MYQDFVDSLNLTKEEGDYFKNLLGKEIGDQQELGMKMLGATAEEQKNLAAELQKRASDSEAEIRKFLNSDEDIKAFTDYKNRLPERQQLDGIRTAMSSKGVPLDAETETKWSMPCIVPERKPRSGSFRPGRHAGNRQGQHRRNL